MKIKILLAILFSLLMILGCASPPTQDRPKLPSVEMEEAESRSSTEEPLKEIVAPQMEEAKKVPEKLFSINARDSSLQDVLLAFSKESELNIVVDPSINERVNVDLRRVTLKEAMDAILGPTGLSYEINDKFIKVSRPQMETRFFTLNYIATRRTGKREVYASTSAGESSQTNTSNTVSGTTGIPQQQTNSGPSTGGSGYTSLISTDEMDLWKELRKGLENIVFGFVEEKTEETATEQGAGQEKATWTKVDTKGKKLVINKSTGVIMVTDYPANLNQVAFYLESVEGSSQRQVTIHAKIMEVALSNEHREGVNWEVIQGLPRATNVGFGFSDKVGTTGYPGTSSGYLTGASSSGGTAAAGIPIPGTLKIMPYGGLFSLGAAGTDIVFSDIMEAIALQGDVKILSSPTISTLNNQKAIIRVGNQDVFFVTGAVATQNTVTQFVQPMTIDIGIILDVTPQIAKDGTIMMNIHPSITNKTGEKTTPDGKSTFPLLSVRETDTTVRVKDGQTIIIAGLIQEKNEEHYTGIPVLQSIPVLGALFRYKTNTKSNAELVIMITPNVQVGQKVQDFTQPQRSKP